MLRGIKTIKLELNGAWKDLLRAKVRQWLEFETTDKRGQQKGFAT